MRRPRRVSSADRAGGDAAPGDRLSNAFVAGRDCRTRHVSGPWRPRTLGLDCFWTNPGIAAAFYLPPGRLPLGRDPVDPIFLMPRSLRLSFRPVLCLLAATLAGAVSAAEPRPLLGPERQRAPEIEPASAEAAQALTRMKLPPGIVAKLWAAEPMLANPVAFNLDERGRVFVAETHRYRTSVLDIRDYMWMLEDELANRTQDDFLATLRRSFGEKGLVELSQESERLVLLEDTNGDGTADKSSVYADDFRTPLDGIASGVIARRGEVWFTNIPSLWKFTGKDRAEQREELFRGFGVRFNFTGHDFHGLVFGPDGRLYFSIGDRGAHVTTKEGRVLDSADTGSVFRCWPDGSELELFATGLRNPQSLLFNEYGDLFTGDNDSDQGDEERLVHLVEGSDSGWRVGYQFAPRGNAGPWNEEKLWHPRHAGQPAYILPAVCNIEDGPSGIAYHPGTGLTPAYAGHIFITHFKGAITNSGIYTYKLKPAGASYAIDTGGAFLTSALPTDVRFGPDGKLYYSDWAEGWPKSKRGRIYAMFDPQRANDPLVKSTQALIASDYTKKTDAELAALLAHPDWRVRLEAQYSLAERGSASTGILAAVTTDTGAAPFARRHAVWALGQIGAHGGDVRAHLRPLLGDTDAEIRAQAAKLLGDLRDTASVAPLVAALTDSSARVKFFAAQSLGKLKADGAIPALLAAIRANDDADAHLRHALVLGLAGCATPEQLAALVSDDSRAVRLAAVLTLRRLGRAELAGFLADRDPLVVRETALAINDKPVTAAFAPLAALAAGSAQDLPTAYRALNAHFRLGTAAAAEALGSFALRPDVAEKLRTEAITLLSLWAEPPARDRNVGIYRPLDAASRAADAGRTVLTRSAADLLTAATPESVKTALLEAIVSLKLDSAAGALHAVVRDAGQPVGVRTAALEALDGFSDPQLAAAAAAALDSGVAELRLAALPISSRLAPADAPAILEKLATTGEAAERRAAFAALADLPGTGADAVLLAQLGELAAGRVPAGAQLDLLDAAAKRADPRIKQLLTARDAELAKSPDPLAPFRVTLEGGNARAGAQLFFRHQVLACIRCHRSSEGGGGEAGPQLAGIGARLSREELLESILKPSAKIAEGYQIVTVNRRNGEAIVGTLEKDDGTTLRLKTGEADAISIPKRDIASLESALSAMPEIAALVLTKAEIRNLIEFVASLKKPVPDHGSQPIRALRKSAE